MTALSTLRFASFKIPNQIFYLSSSRTTMGIVNLKPLVPGHVLVVPTRVTPRLKDLTPEEVGDLFASVQQISRVIEKEYRAHALNIALQDGPLAGQSVPHVHVHIIPRRAKDFEPIDEMYNALDAFNLSQQFTSFEAAYASRPSRSDRKAQAHAQAQSHPNSQAQEDRDRSHFAVELHARETGNVETPFKGIEDEERKPRSRAEMREETERLAELFPAENRGSFEEENEAGEKEE
ncbi:hypothetical protein JCM11641_005122 [Rhodosporidiobolus odoratus]